MSIARANTYTKKCYCANNQTMVVGAMLFYRPHFLVASTEIHILLTEIHVRLTEGQKDIFSYLGRMTKGRQQLFAHKVKVGSRIISSIQSILRSQERAEM